MQGDAAAPNRSTHEHTGHNEPTAPGTTTTPVEVTLLSAVGDDGKTTAPVKVTLLSPVGDDGTTTTPVEVTLLSAVGDDCTTLAAPRDATPEAKRCWLMRMVAQLWLRRPVTTGYASWLGLVKVMSVSYTHLTLPTS